MNGFTYTLILEEPVLANSLSGDTNSARSLPFIPGGLMRGALINNYTGDKKAGDKDFQRLFLNGKTRFLHAYPVGIYKREEQELVIRRMLPTPISWKEYKDQSSSGIENFASQVKTDVDLKNASFPFYILENGVVVKAKHEWQVNVHTQRDAVYGRAKGQGKGAVFRYEALPVGLHLEGIVLAENKADADALQAMLPKHVMLGKARTAGYGRARIEIGSDLDDTWREDTSSSLPNKTNSFTVTLLSDTILRDANGQVTLDPIPALKVILGVNDLETKHTFHKVEIVGGFNRQWGLPLPQSQALGAGSVIVVESASGVEKEALARLERLGLGDRKSEGFGRVTVSVNPKEHYDFDTENGKLKFESKKSASLLPAEEPVADLMLKRLLRRDLDEKILSAVIIAVSEYKGGVKNSQLSRWRVNLRSAIGSNTDVGKIRDFFKKEDSRNSPSWQKMTRVRVKIKKKEQDNDKEVLKLIDIRLTEWMESLIENEADLWNMLGYLGDKQPIKTIGSKSLDARGNFETEYSLRLIDAVLASITKKNNVEGGSNGR